MKAKDFDCVEMKHAIQQRILEEFGGLSPEEQRRRTQELIQRDPLLAYMAARPPHGYRALESPGVLKTPTPQRTSASSDLAHHPAVI